MSAANYRLILEKNADLSVFMTLYDADGALVDLFGYSAAASGAVSKGGTPTWSIDSTPSGGIQLGGSQGTIQIDITDTTITALTESVGYWDLVLTDAVGAKRRLIEGRYEVRAGVTS